MTTSIETLLNGSFPYAFCYSCLSSKLDAPEAEIRAGALELLRQPQEWQPRRRMCNACGTVTEILERRI